MNRSYPIFISSVASEFAAERKALKEYITRDAFLGAYFPDVFVFEIDVPARDRLPDDVYLSEIDRRAIYLSLFGKRYGRIVRDGLSATALEFRHATTTKSRPERLAFVRELPEGEDREPAMASFIGTLQPNLVYGRFSDLASLQAEVYRALVDFLKRRGALPVTPFDASPCEGASMRDISAGKVEQFLRLSKGKGRLNLSERSSPGEVLKNFHLLAGRTPTRAAVLLFGAAPNRLLPGVEVQCLRFDGREKSKPIGDQRTFVGTAFEMIESALGFVLEKIESRVGIARGGASAPVAPEIPEFVVREAIVNAVAHRDYSSRGFVQVIVFADRVEVWNPGHLPHGMSPQDLRVAHGPVPRNPLISEPLFRAGYAEKAGTGTTDMIRAAVAAGLPEPDFEQRGPHFVVTMWRDWLTPERLAALQLPDRLLSAVLFVKDRGRISNSQYQNQFRVAKRTASQDLARLAERGLIEREGTTGKGVFYRMAKGAPKEHEGHDGGQMDAARSPRGNGAPKGHKGHDRKDATRQPGRPGRKRRESP